MAEVTGKLGGEEIILNNAATETTLRELVSAIGILSTKINAANGKKTQAQIERELKKFHQQLTAGNAAVSKMTKAEREALLKKTKNTKATKDNTDAIEENTDKISMAGQAYGAIAKTVGLAANAFVGLVNTLKSVSEMGNSLTGAANVFGQVPVVGGILSSTFGAVAGAVESSYDAFKTSASVGANFTGSIHGMIDAASSAGLTIDEFSGIIARNGRDIALLGGGSAEGARQVARLGKELRQQGLADRLARLGYSTEEMNESMAQFGGRLARTGRAQQMSTTQLARVTASYLEDLDAVAKLTGQSKKALQEQEDARMRDAQYLALKNKLDATGQKNLETLMNSIPEGMREGAKEVLATGTATSEAGENFLAYMQASGRNLSQLSNSIRRSGTLTEQQTIAAYNGIQQEGAKLSQSKLGETIALFDKAAGTMVVGAYELNARQQNNIDLEKVLAKQRAESAKLERLKDQALDPASIERYKREIAETSNQFVKTLANSKLLDSMFNSFQKLIPILETTLVPIFEKVANNSQLIGDMFQFLADTVEFVIKNFKAIGLIGGGGLVAGIAMMATKGTALNPMYVKMGGMTGDAFGDMMDGGDGKKKGGPKSKGKLGAIKNLAKVGKSVVRRLPVVGAAVTAGMGAMEYNDINKQLEAGEITQTEATKAKSKTVGGTSGVIAGAAAGAAIGSVVPIVGTLIGGALGAALGGWLGSKGGEAVGEAMTKDSVEMGGSAKADLEKSAETKAKAQVEAEKEAKAEVKIAETPELTSQDDSEALLLSLNTKMEQLIKIASNQLIVQRNLGGNVNA